MALALGQWVPGHDVAVLFDRLRKVFELGRGPFQRPTFADIGQDRLLSFSFVCVSNFRDQLVLQCSKVDRDRGS